MIYGVSAYCGQNLYRRFTDNLSALYRHFSRTFEGFYRRFTDNHLHIIVGNVK